MSNAPRWGLCWASAEVKPRGLSLTTPPSPTLTWGGGAGGRALKLARKIVQHHVVGELERQLAALSADF